MKNRFTSHTRLFLMISGIIIAAALVMQIAGVGLNLGIDFTGGSLLNYSVGEDFDTADVEKILSSAGYEGSQITKAAPSDASIALQAELAAATEEVTEETAEAAGTILDPDKSGIKADGLTDLQIRLNLVDESAGLGNALAEAVHAQVSGAEIRTFGRLTNTMIISMGLENQQSGSHIAEISADGEIDADALKAVLSENYSIESIAAVPCEEDDGCNLRLIVALNDQASQIRALLEKEMSAKYPNFAFVSIDHVSAIAGRDLLSNAVKALLIAFACMLVYIAIRFDVFSGLAALFGLAHDVLIMMSFMVFFRAVYQVNSSFIAAILTIVGYSINNTIIVFDRIRETAKKPGYGEKSRKEIVELSVGATLSRTINTTLTTLITLAALYIFGVESIREFAFPLIVGMLAGTYSSVLLSGQVWASWMEKAHAKKFAKAKKA